MSTNKRSKKFNTEKFKRHLTKYFSVRKLNPFVFSRWSISRPGVARIDNKNKSSNFFLS